MFGLIYFFKQLTITDRFYKQKVVHIKGHASLQTRLATALTKYSV